MCRAGSSACICIKCCLFPFSQLTSRCIAALCSYSLIYITLRAVELLLDTLRLFDMHFSGLYLASCLILAVFGNNNTVPTALLRLLKEST